MATMVGKQKDLVDLLNNLIELDFDAVKAYEAAIDKLQDVTAKAEMQSFMGDHQRHIRELSDVVTEMGAQPKTGPDAKQILTKGKVVIAGLMGDKAILTAMKTNEDDTNTAYERATKRTDLPQHVMRLCERNLQDERRHRSWIEARLESFGQPSATR